MLNDFIFKLSENKKIFYSIIFLLITFWFYPIWYMYELAITGDGNIFLQRFEAIRKTVIDYSQWPANNPWNAGGQPLEGVNGRFLISIKGFLSIIFGAKTGLGVTLVLFNAIGYFGSLKLASVFWRTTNFHHIFALLVISNSAILFHLSAGHFNFLNYYLIPIILYYFILFDKDKWSGLKAGILLGIAFNENPTYLVQFLILILSTIGIFHFFKSSSEIKKKIFFWILTFLPVFGMIISFHLIALLYTIGDFPRSISKIFFYPIETIIKSFFYPFIDIDKKAFSDPVGVSAGSCSRSTHENAMYVGILSIPFIIASFYKGIKWWHVVSFILILCAIGNNSFILPMYWIQKIPTYESWGCFNRIRMITSIFITICIVHGMSFMYGRFKDKILSIRILLTQRSFPIKKTSIVLTLILLVTVERLLIGHLIIYDTHKTYDVADRFYSTYKKYEKNKEFFNVSVIPPYEATLNNIGILRGGGDSHLPMDYGEKINGEYPGTIGFDEEDYIGEFYQNKTVVKPDYWSPNLIKFSKLNPNVPLAVNMNRSKFWYANGKKLFPNDRIIEVKKKFLALPDKQGNLILSYIYPGKKIGVVLTILFFLSLCITCLLNKKYNIKRS
tara:strand:- start:4756 stop:6600 length:1845 start_codon:yes stop_codon:yes gene_type:complete